MSGREREEDCEYITRGPVRDLRTATDQSIRVCWFGPISRPHAVDLTLWVLRRHRLAILRGVRHHNVIEGILTDGADGECDWFRER